jgi:hypothetical protein
MEKRVSTVQRLEKIERRLEALERGPPVQMAVPGDEPLWALRQLQAQEFDGVLFAGQLEAPGVGRVGWQYGLSARTLLAQDWDAASPVLAALGHPARLRLLRAVLGGQIRNADLSELPGVGSTGQLYHHLRELVAAGWLKSAGRGSHRVPAERVVPLLTILAATEALDAHLPEPHVENA